MCWSKRRSAAPSFSAKRKHWPSCRTHDKCYENYGYLNSMCDKELIQALNQIQTDDPAEDLARQAIILYFENSPKI